MKHAYLIIAHSDVQLLAAQMRMLDDERNDIFLHVDKKSCLLNEFTPSTVKASLYVLAKRIDVRWGDVSLVQVEYLLMEEALKHGPYAYYHLISGCDLPIQTQDTIHDFFAKHQGKEFIQFQESVSPDEYETKMCRWHIFPRNQRNMHPFYVIARKIWRRIQKIMPLRSSKYPLYKGPEWVSITQQMVEVTMSYKDWALRRFRFTSCSDEMLFQTIVHLTPLYKNVYRPGLGENSYMRLIDWNRGNPYIWRLSEKSEIEYSKMMFARKFSSDVDSGIIKWVEEKYSMKI